MTNIISIIVPVYNVEKYLARALESILAQTYHAWEAILVDDGSTDKSGSIADEYAQKDERFKVIHKKNGGLSDARNVGMEHVNGEYLLFLDSDDFLHPQLMELCLQAAQRDSSDLVVFTYNRSYRNINRLLHQLHLPEMKPCFKYYKNPASMVTDNIFNYITDYTRPKDIPYRWAVKHCQVCFKMYKTAIVRNICFTPNMNYEDIPWWGEVLLKIQRTTILNLPLYYYYPNQASYTLSATLEQQIFDLEKSIALAQNVFKQAPAEKRDHWERHFTTPLLQTLKKKYKKLKRITDKR